MTKKNIKCHYFPLFMVLSGTIDDCMPPSNAEMAEAAKLKKRIDRDLAKVSPYLDELKRGTAQQQETAASISYCLQNDLYTTALNVAEMESLGVRESQNKFVAYVRRKAQFPIPAERAIKYLQKIKAQREWKYV